jgi:hypothetical protein
MFVAFSHEDGSRRKRDDWMAYVDRVLKNPLWRRRIIETGKPTSLVQTSWWSSAEPPVRRHSSQGGAESRPTSIEQ